MEYHYSVSFMGQPICVMGLKRSRFMLEQMRTHAKYKVAQKGKKLVCLVAEQMLQTVLPDDSDWKSPYVTLLLFEKFDSE